VHKYEGLLITTPPVSCLRPLDYIRIISYVAFSRLTSFHGVSQPIIDGAFSSNTAVRRCVYGVIAMRAIGFVSRPVAT
jgi:hypothetical protein